ncbi:MAG: DUF3160 domain-containing protein, partial [Chloroflexi bacterium]|nr:DUF3160 domain-containing protein [Chloroflexota bacterium]
EAWQDKSLRTALASWTELRHDTILYAKQSYTAVVTSVPPPAKGYVEPVPELYARLGALARMTREGLQGLDAIEEFDRARLSNLEQLLARLQEVSVRELRGEAPTDADTGFFTNLPYTLHTVVTGVEPEGLRTAMVADVHTDPNDPAEVLEEGVGNVELVVVAVPGPDGALMLAAGPVLSYYEFKQPMSDRLTDEAWRQMLKDDGPEPPRWTGSFYRVE